MNEDVYQARELLRRCPAGHERVAASLTFNYDSPLGKREPPDPLVELFERARSAALSPTDDYAQPPESLEQIGRRGSSQS